LCEIFQDDEDLIKKLLNDFDVSDGSKAAAAAAARYEVLLHEETNIQTM
jgi:hypothetical protein